VQDIKVIKNQKAHYFFINKIAFCPIIKKESLMKLCIYQLAFIAVIICCCKVLHPYHEHLAKVTGYHLQDLADQIANLSNELVQEGTMSEKLHDHVATTLDSKDKTLSGKERSSITHAQREADSTLVRKRQQIERAHHYLEKSKEMLVSAVNLLKDGNKRTKAALSGVHSTNQQANQKAQKGLSKEELATKQFRSRKNKKSKQYATINGQTQMSSDFDSGDLDPMEHIQV
jgi:hypothetical protein